MNIVVLLPDGTWDEYRDTNPSSRLRGGLVDAIVRHEYSVGHDGTLTIRRLTYSARDGGTVYHNMTLTDEVESAHYRPAAWLKAYETAG